jgi:tripartite-type tricarboxylate transporter receptor subunit TctC
VSPAAVPRDIVSKLNAEVVRIVGLADVKRNLTSQGADPLVMTPDEFSDFMKTETAKWAKIVKASGARAD